MASSSPPHFESAEGARRHVLALYGPTASGKTRVAGILRERLGAEVVSADSAALYAGLRVLTASPPYPAALVGVVPLEQEVSVGAYQRLAHAAIDAAARPLVVGGTGLYLRAALAALDLPPAPAAGRRTYWQAEYDRLGPEGAHALLARRDPAAANRVHPNDRRRVVRALELAEAGATLAPAVNRLWSDEARLPTLLVTLDVPLEELDRRIALRTHEMAAAGAAEEARSAWSRPLSATARKVLGLEAFATLPEEKAIECVTQATRRLARYQRKWLRRLPAAATLDGSRPAEELAAEIISLERERKRLPGRRGAARR